MSRSHRYTRSSITRTGLSNTVCTPDGRDFTVSTPIFDNFELVKKGRATPLVLIGGFGEQNFGIRNSLVRLAQMGIPAVSPVVQFCQMPRSIERNSNEMFDAALAIGSQVPITVINHVAELSETEAPIKAIAASSGGGLLGLALQYAEEVGSDSGLTINMPLGDTVLIAPAGLSALHGSVEETGIGLLGRFLSCTAGTYPPRIRGSVPTTIDITSGVFAERRTFTTGLNLANTADNSSAVVAHANKSAVSIISGADDRLFPLADMREMLLRRGGRLAVHDIPKGMLNMPHGIVPTDPGITLYQIEGMRHENLSYPIGQKALRLAAQLLHR